MEIDQTVSVSKGVFVFKNGIKAANKRSKSKKKQPVQYQNIFSGNLWYQTYSNLWNNLENLLENLNREMFSSVLCNLIEYIRISYTENVNEIPTAALLTGINMPDHGAQFTTLAKQIKDQVSPHVACLHSQDCQNLKYMVENMISQIINDGLSSDEEEDIKEDKSKFMRKNLCNFALLQAWYEDLYITNHKSPSPKKQKTKNKKKVLVIIIPDFESFNHKVLQDFILIASTYMNVLPFVLVFGVATSLTSLHKCLPYHVSSKISVQVFNSQPSTIYLNNVLEDVFFSLYCPFQLGGRVFNLFIDIFLFYDLSVTGFIKNFKYAMLEHFCFGNAMALCDMDNTYVRDVLKKFTHEDCENARHILSFRKLVESESYENRIKLLSDDEYFKKVLEECVKKLRRYIKRYNLFLKCLYILVKNLPKAPLGKQLRELYSLGLSKNITKSQEYKECFQLLAFQSKEELCTKLSGIINIISQDLNDSKQSKFTDMLTQLNTHLNSLISIEKTDFNTDEVEEMETDNSNDDIVSGKMDRKQLKEKLLMGMSKPNTNMNRYEKLRQTILSYLSQIFEEYLVEHTSLYFHEIFFFNDISIQNHIIGTHRSAIHSALNDPSFYLQCSCCEISNDTQIRPSMPDISIAYKLHLECGKMINLYDWLQAFLCIVDENIVEEDSKQIVDPELQARFTQAVAELEFLGFIKSSKRKADHVARLTWGG